MKPLIKVAGIDDVAEIANLHRLSHRVSFAPFASEAWLQSRDDWDYEGEWTRFFERAAANPRARAWKATLDDQITGIVKVAPESEIEAQLTSMHVLPDLHGRGIGTALFTSAMAFMREAGYTSGMLGVIQANERARAFYERYGWTVRELRDDGVEGVPVAIYEIAL